MSFTSADLEQRLNQFPQLINARRLIVGFSGGLDSCVLLHALTNLDLEPGLVALHINHSIQPQADQWQQQCAKIASQFHAEFHAIKIDARHPAGESPEAWARHKRYAAFTAFMQQGDVLLLAHHLDDQIETFFLQLLRGSGPHGLAAMPSVSEFSSGWIFRPLLDLTRESLQDYARQQQLIWIEDPSNQDQRYDRNYLRHQLVPILRARWPGYMASLQRAISLQADASQILDIAAAYDLSGIVLEAPAYASACLSITKLQLLNDTRQRNALRHWIRKAGFNLPSERKLRQVTSAALCAGADRSPCVNWNGAEIRRYREQLLIMPALPEQDASVVYHWDLEEPLQLTAGVLSAIKSIGHGLRANNAKVTVRFRHGGEHVRPAGSPHSTTLKKYFQENAVPPWLRDRIPLIFRDDKLVAVADFCVMEGEQAAADEEGWRLIWHAVK